MSVESNANRSAPRPRTPDVAEPKGQFREIGIAAVASAVEATKSRADPPPRRREVPVFLKDLHTVE